MTKKKSEDTLEDLIRENIVGQVYYANVQVELKSLKLVVL
jgi:hypothetical protein